MLKLLAEMSPFCGDMEKLESNLTMMFTKLLVSKPSKKSRLIVRDFVSSGFYLHVLGVILCILGNNVASGDLIQKL